MKKIRAHPVRSLISKRGDLIRNRELVTIHGTRIPLPDPERLVHLQFRRYAGCPVCNMHLRSFAKRDSEIVAAGIKEVVVFHSSTEKMIEFQGQLPFAAIADPQKKLYAEVGADRKMSPLAAMSPRSWATALNALARVHSSRSDGQRGGDYGPAI
jgi:peroxiredoxin